VTAYSNPDWVRSGYENELNLQTNYDYNFFTGLVENETNPDDIRTHYDYDNALRLNQVILHAGLQQDLQVVETTKFDQDPNGNDLLTYISQTSYADQGTTKVITGKQWFDGSGRVMRAGTGTGGAPGSYDTVATVYDSWGRVVKRSNPYAGDANGNPQSGVTQFWTESAYDELSRVKLVTLPDTQTIQTDYSGATATSGDTVVTTDTVGRKHKSESDGLGRLVKVTEQNPANGNLEWETSYSYDVLDNLTQTNQGGQLRTFTYDAKSRLISETLPEAGTTTYAYTDFDAVSARTDARGVVTTYTYGPLNLPAGVSYNTASATGVATTAPVSITYKSDSPGKGQAKTVTDGAGSESYGFDSFGRLQSSIRVIDGISYQKQYEYNTANQMTLMTYPSGKRVKVGSDARGRLADLKKVDDSGATQDTYLSGITYRADGRISSQNLGDSTTENFGYSNDRLQLTSQTVTNGSNTLLNLSYGYGAGAGQMGYGTTSGNSGQLVSISGTINGQGRNQAFTYDNVERLVTATGWGTWARRHDYDRYGNRTAVWDAVSGGNQLQNTVMEQVGGIKTNRIASVNGTAFSYDASGNVTVDGASTFTYDAESRIVSVSGLSSESYGYDAKNHRVKKVVGGVVTHYIWEGDQVIAEYERGGGATQATGTRYYHQDRLSTRVITDSPGNVKGTTDHLPFGEELSSTGESEKHKFTTYERDGTGPDYAVNRHYDSRQGRFNQVDPLGMGAVSLAEPQSLNLYSYVQNDPLGFADPDGKKLQAVVYKSASTGHYEIGYLDVEIAQAFYGLVRELENFTYNVDFTYLFRTTAEQTQLYNNRANNSNPVAVPGTSAHESGLAFDINRNGLANQGLDLNGLRDIASFFEFYPLPNGGDPPHLQASGVLPLTRQNKEYLARIEENQGSYKEISGIYNEFFRGSLLPKDENERRRVLEFQAIAVNYIYLLQTCGYHGEACGRGGYGGGFGFDSPFGRIGFGGGGFFGAFGGGDGSDNPSDFLVSARPKVVL
jgi:RHS repeat-associated protein